jgi:hypothetical protein
MAKKDGSFVQSVAFGRHTLKIAYLDGTCYPVAYNIDVGNGFTVNGTVWVCDPLDDSYTDGEIDYLGAKIATYHLDKRGTEIDATVAGVAKFKLRLNLGERKLQYMRCPFNGDIFNPGYDCPNDWVTLLSW